MRLEDVASLLTHFGVGRNYTSNCLNGRNAVFPKYSDLKHRGLDSSSCTKSFDFRSTWETMDYSKKKKKVSSKSGLYKVWAVCGVLSDWSIFSEGESQPQVG